MIIQVNPRRIEIRNAALCGVAVLIACLLTCPFAQMPFNDDWSYSFTVKRLAQTGHLIYNGWSSPSLIAQAYWGLIWVKLFGFSFNVLRSSTLPLAAGSGAITYLLGRRAALSISASFFASLMLGLSPLFLPLATSFMTDIPACFCLLFSLYALIRAGESAPVQWMLIGVVVGAIGGSSRQIDWVVPLALLPYLAWQLRRNRLHMMLAIALWLATFSMAAAVQHWFELQPFAIPEPPFRYQWTRATRDPNSVITRFIMILITLFLITLPAGITLFARVRRSRSALALSGLLLLTIGRALLSQRRYAVGPWMINIVSAKGVLSGGLIAGDRPDMLPHLLLAIVSLIVFATIALFLSVLILSLKHTRSFFTCPPLVAMVLVCFGYLALLLTRCAMDFTLFDRHLVTLIPIAGIPLLRLGQKIPVASWVLLALFGIYALGSTQEELSSMRARATAAHRLQEAGVPRTQFGGGFDYDAWTQLETTGYINDSRIKLPAGAYHPVDSRLPNITPIYRIEYGPTHDSQATKFGTVSYFSLWPPFERHVSIDRVSGS